MRGSSIKADIDSLLSFEWTDVSEWARSLFFANCVDSVACKRVLFVFAKSTCNCSALGNSTFKERGLSSCHSTYHFSKLFLHVYST